MKQNSLIKAATVFVILLVILLTVTLGIEPRIAEIGANATTLSQAQSQLDLQQSKLAQLIALSKQRDALQANLDNLKSAIPEQLGISDFVRQLNSNAAVSKVSITGIEIGDPTSYVAPQQISEDQELAASLSSLGGAKFYYVDLKMTLTGTFSAMQTFMDKFQNNPRTVILHSFSYNNFAGGSGDNTLALTAQIFMLYK